MAEPLVILGTGAFAEEIADVVAAVPGWLLAGFVEGLDREKCRMRLLGLPVTWIDDAGSLAGRCRAVCAVGSTRREHFVEQARAAGLDFATLVHPSAVVFPSATLEEGVIVGAGAVIGARSAVGAHTILNRGCLVGHHVRLGRFVTVGPGANLAARVRIGDGTFVGIGAILVNDVTVGAGSFVVAGSLVARDVADAVQVAGAPARVVRTGIERV